MCKPLSFLVPRGKLFTGVMLYIVQAICNQTLPPGTLTQLEQILLMFCFYLKYPTMQ